MYDDDSSQKLLAKDEHSVAAHQGIPVNFDRFYSKSVTSRSRVSLLVLLLLVSVGANFILVFILVRQPDASYQVVEQTSQYCKQARYRACFKAEQTQGSPILADLSIQYQTTKFDSTLFGNSVYRANASPEVDEAWIELGLKTTQIVNERDADRVGFSSGMVKRRSSDGGGFIAQMEVFHQLHCLDTLRQGLYFNYEYFHSGRGGVWGRSDAVVRKHMGHCLDLLRMQLQCSADTGLVGMMWVNTSSGVPTPFADFSRQHKCRNFDAIKAWAHEHDEKGVVEVRPGDDVASDFP